MNNTNKKPSFRWVLCFRIGTWQCPSSLGGEERCTAGACRMPNGMRQVMNGRALRDHGSPLRDGWPRSSTLVLVLKTKNPAFAGFFVLELGPGSVLLSHGEAPHYHRR